MCDLFESNWINCVFKVVLGDAVKPGFFGGFLNIAFGYGLALMVGILVSGGVR